MTKKQSKNGYILHEGDDIVVIAVGFASASANSKTGGMIQVYILHRHLSPLNAVRSGADSLICGDCQHRGNKGQKRRCYVNLGQGPRSVWECYKRGGYGYADPAEYRALFSGKRVRFGAYGDPAFIPERIVRAIASVAERWTGYTHQWRANGNAWLRDFVMASCDSVRDASDAIAANWRYFRVARRGDSARLSREISCPASAEAGKKTTCSNCCLCDGSRADDRRANIVIQDHSVIARSQPMGLFVVLA